MISFIAHLLFVALVAGLAWILVQQVIYLYRVIVNGGIIDDEYDPSSDIFLQSDYDFKDF